MSEVRIVGVYDSDGVSYQNSFVCKGESRTRQEFKVESDINTIIERFGIGENPITAQKWVTNLDISDSVDDYQTAMNQLVAASSQFNSLPAKLRSRFDNDPSLFVNFVSDSSNLQEMIDLGLAVKRVDPPPSDTDRIISALEKGRGTVSS